MCILWREHSCVPRRESQLNACLYDASPRTGVETSFDTARTSACDTSGRDKLPNGYSKQAVKHGDKIGNTLIACGTLMALSIAAGPSNIGRLFFLDLRAGRVLSANPDGSDLKVLLEGNKTGMDGIVVDPADRHIFWTNMGKMKADDGSIERLDLDGNNLAMVVPAVG